MVAKASGCWKTPFPSIQSTRLSYTWEADFAFMWKRILIEYNAFQLCKKGRPAEVVPLDLPREYAADVYLSVRLGAGALHLANYLIHVAAYFLLQRWGDFSDLQNFG